jgi:hypothetical protein
MTATPSARAANINRPFSIPAAGAPTLSLLRSDRADPGSALRPPLPGLPLPRVACVETLRREKPFGAFNRGEWLMGQGKRRKQMAMKSEVLTEVNSLRNYLLTFRPRRMKSVRFYHPVLKQTFELVRHGRGPLGFVVYVVEQFNN